MTQPASNTVRIGSLAVPNPAVPAPTGREHTISVVIPVYGGEHTLADVVAEIAPMAEQTLTTAGHRYRVAEVLLVFDCGRDGSPDVIRALAEKYDFVRPVWLSRNFGQHAATLAGMASSGGDWIVTLDEDGQHDPAAIPRFLDVALRERVQLVYALPTNLPPHGVARNTASRAAKWMMERLLAGDQTSAFQSYRLVLGEIGRSVAAYAGSGVYLDVAMGWVTGSHAQCPVELRAEGSRPSGYSVRRLLSHFWRLVLSSGTRGLRLVSILGAAFGLGGVILAVGLGIGSIAGGAAPQGWTSTIVTVLLGTGAVLFSLGVIAEYIGVAVNMAMGKPLYLIVGDSKDGPLGRVAPDRGAG